MEIVDFVEKMAEQFDETDAAVFTPQTKFKELDEWSSLVALSVIAMVDESYKVRLKGVDVRESSTINDLFNIVKARAQ
ncbi:MAG: acyl carrier protein [Bacteroidales bacterium]|nr:acyl carrier protein [Bacteroidales bacterium]